MKLYKLTDEKDRTYNDCQWGEGVEHTAFGEGDLCGPGWLHAYTDPLLAVLLNLIHANFSPKTYHLWECEGDVGRTDHGLKVGCTRIKTLRRVEPSKVTPEQHIRFAILCVMRVCHNKAWRAWAEKWLSGEDRSADSARKTEIAVWMDRDHQPINETDAMCDAAVAVASTYFSSAWAVSHATRVADPPLPLAEIAREAVEDSR